VFKTSHISIAISLVFSSAVTLPGWPIMVTYPYQNDLLGLV